MRETTVADFGTQRLNMVESQVRPSDVTDRHLMTVLQTLPRELFVPEWGRAVAYGDGDLAVSRAERGSPPRCLLAPRTLARLIQAAEIASSDRVLDVGCATGYSTAVLARLAANVVGLEQDKALAEAASNALKAVGAANATIVQNPLADGWPKDAPYDAIVVNGSVAAVPQSLLAQLSPAGRLVAIVTGGDQPGGRSRPNGAGVAQLFTKSANGIGLRTLFDAGAPELPGFSAQAGFVF